MSKKDEKTPSGKRGRPTINPDERLGLRVTIRLAVDDYLYYSKLADERGMTLAYLIRTALKNLAKTPK